MRFIRIVNIIMLLSLAGCGKPPHQVQGYIEGHNLYLASPFSGLLEKLWVKKGDRVKANQVLFSLDAEPQLSKIQENEAVLSSQAALLKDLENPRRLPEIDAIRAQIDQVDASLSLAQIRVKRLEKLYQQKATDKDTLDAAVAKVQEQLKLKEQYESDLKLATLGSREEQINAKEADVAASKARLGEAKWESAQKTMNAPFDGIIFDDYYRQGEFVAAGQPVLSLLTPQNTDVVFYLPLVLVEKLAVGQKIQFHAEVDNKLYPATIAYVSPEAEFMPPLIYSRENSDKLVYRIEASFAAFDTFKPGQPVIVILP